MAALIQNPVLPGFNPDPSILRVGEDYYIATSTFEWFPGVQIHHSRDLVHWELLTHPLNRLSQLDLTGVVNSGGIWAPDLSYDNGTFYLVYTIVKNWRQNFKDCHNYLVTASAITGPWSEPIYLNSSGFDPSLFHDEDGRKWLLNMLWDYRPGRSSFAGIVLQEYSSHVKKLVGQIENIFRGTSLGVTEGPHIYRRNDYYYLLTAEGGTGYEHAVTMARSRALTGPYEVDPQNPVLTSVGDPTLALQKAGHASLVETQTGEWYLAHLCGRPLPAANPLQRRCNLGRETALQRCYWSDEGWLRLETGDNRPQLTVTAPNLARQSFEPSPFRDDFEQPQLGVHWSTLRTSADPDWLSLSERPGFLRLRGRESLNSWHNQSLVGRRLQAFRAEAQTCLEFEPVSFQQAAGLICFYDTQNYLYLRLSYDPEKGAKSLGIVQCESGRYAELAEQAVAVQGWQRCHLKVVINWSELRFFYSPDREDWQPLGSTFDASRLSDEYGHGEVESQSFTGTFIGLCAQDLSGQRVVADFDYFDYRELAV
jgi:xylan 1,4-beta-xylosidase